MSERLWPQVETLEELLVCEPDHDHPEHVFEKPGFGKGGECERCTLSEDSYKAALEIQRAERAAYQRGLREAEEELVEVRRQLTDHASASPAAAAHRRGERAGLALAAGILARRLRETTEGEE